MGQMRIFVSHSHEDKAFCDALVRALRGAGADVWYDEHNLGAGQLMDEITRELQERPIFIVILSPAALSSEWVKQECRWVYVLYSRQPSRVILPVTVRTITANDLEGWLFLETFKRIEAPGFQPLGQTLAIERVFTTLGIQHPQSQPHAKQPDNSATDPLPNDEDRLLLAADRLQQKRHRNLCSLGWKEMRRGHLEQAINLLQQATRMNRPPHEQKDAWRGLVYSLERVGRFEEQLDACWELLATTVKSRFGGTVNILWDDWKNADSSENAFAWEYMGNALVHLKRYEDALTAYRKALSCLVSDGPNPVDFDYAIEHRSQDHIHLNIAYVLLLQCRYREAWDAVRRVGYCEMGASCETCGSKCALKGHSFVGLGCETEALDAYNHALEHKLNRDAARRVWEGKATALRTLKREAEAAVAEARAMQLASRAEHAN